MPLDFDPIYHTETMVKILREQGSTQYAMELAEAILRAQPQHEGVAKILEEIKEEVRKNFEKFRNSGRVAETGTAETSESTEGAADTVAASAPSPAEACEPRMIREFAENLEEIDAPVLVSEKEKPEEKKNRKISQLQCLLEKIRSYRKNYEVRQA